jgi:hypothetical protein
VRLPLAVGAAPVRVARTVPDNVLDAELDGVADGLRVARALADADAVVERAAVGVTLGAGDELGRAPLGDVLAEPARGLPLAASDRDGDGEPAPVAETDAERATDPVPPALAEARGDALSEALRAAVAEALALAVLERDAAAGVAVTQADALEDPLADGQAVCDTLTRVETDSDVVAVTDVVALGVREPPPERESVALVDGESVVEIVGDSVLLPRGEPDADALRDGDGEADAHAVAVKERAGVFESAALRVSVGAAVAVFDAIECDGVDVCVGVGVVRAEALAPAEDVSIAAGDRDPEAVTVMRGERDSRGVVEADVVADAQRDADGEPEGDRVLPIERDEVLDVDGDAVALPVATCDREELSVAGGERVAAGVGVGRMLCVARALVDGDGETVCVRETRAEAEDDAVTVGEAVAVSDADALRVASGEPEPVGDADVVRDAAGVTDARGEPDEDGVADGEPVGEVLARADFD